MVIQKLIREVDLDDLKLRITWFFNAENAITPEIQKIILELRSLTTPQEVLSFLVINKFIGYLNYELIKAFQKAVKCNEMKIKIEEYEKKHDVFLRQFSYSAMIDAFQKNPKLAPVSVVGLPEFTVKLKTPWEGKDAYTWKEFFEKLDYCQHKKELCCSHICCSSIFHLFCCKRFARSSHNKTARERRRERGSVI